jgi:hypothetical protein
MWLLLTSQACFKCLPDETPKNIVNRTKMFEADILSNCHNVVCHSGCKFVLSEYMYNPNMCLIWNKPLQNINSCEQCKQEVQSYGKLWKVKCHIWPSCGLTYKKVKYQKTSQQITNLYLSSCYQNHQSSHGRPSLFHAFYNENWELTVKRWDNK